jgi:hypothetical protein
MQFALVLILCVSGLVTLQWSFLFGGLDEVQGQKHQIRP